MAEMKLNKEIIAFNRGRVVVKSDKLVDPRNLDEHRNLVLIALLQELKNYRYFLSSEVLCRISVEEMEELHKNLLPELEDRLHYGETFKPLYPGFPEQVLSKTQSELWMDQNRVYSGDLEGFIKDNPWVSKEERKEIENEPDRELKIMTPEEFMNIPQQIMSAGNSLTENTRNELEWFLDNYKDLIIPERIPFKETMCIVAKHRPEYVIMEVNDVLRYGLYIMGADPSLPNVPKKIYENSWSKRKKDNPKWRDLKTMPRQKRREICQRLEIIIEKKGVDICLKDAKLFYGHWILLSERVHPREYVVNYPECADFFTKLKNRNLLKEYPTFNAQVQKMYDTGKDILEIAKFISKRPGDLVRRFDSLLRKSIEENKESNLMDIFIETEGMKNKTLLEILGYYDKREQNAPRMVNIPGKGIYKLDSLEPINSGILETVRENIIRKVLLNIDSRITEKDLLNKIVYLDPEIKKIPIPKGMRTQNISVPKGIRYILPKDKNFVRFFVHWIQNDIDEDLDLHAFLYKDENDCRNIGWNTMYVSDGAVHSGDVLNQPGNCAEYVDIDIDTCKSNGYKYVVMDVYNYKGRGMNTLPVWLGYCTVNRLEGNNKHWYPQDVEVTIPVTSKSSKVAAMMVDLKKREMIILDCELDGIPVNTSTNYGLQKAIVEYFSKPEKYSSYEILEQHYKSRGAIIVNVMPDDPETEIAEKVTFEDISQDYVRILNIIGE